MFQSTNTKQKQIGNYVVDWPAIVEQHGPSVWRTAYRLLSDREEANDCYQETFVSALHYSRKQEIANWSGLLRRIATSKSLDRLRRRYRSRTEPLQDEATVLGREESPDGPALREEWMQQLRRAVAELQEQHAEVFLLSEVEGLKHAEIAEYFEASPAQVANWLHRAKQKLRRLLVERGIAGGVKQ